MQGTATISLSDLDRLRKLEEESKKAVEVIRDIQDAISDIVLLTGAPSDIADRYNSKQRSTALKFKEGRWQLERRK
jgi:hypothetical protein